MSTTLLIFFTIITICYGQTNPQAWSRGTRNQASQEVPNEVTINTDRLARTIETRIMNLVRHENNEIKQQLKNLQDFNSKVEEDLSLLKTDLKLILDKLKVNEGQVQGTEDNSTTTKLNYLYSLMNTMRGSFNRIERDVLYLRKNIRAVQNAKHQMQQISSYAHHVSNEIINPQTCSANDQNPYSGIRQLKRDFVIQCDMETDKGGWTIIQARYSGKIDFARSWIEYKEGFGNIAEEFWLGLDKIYELTSQRLYELRIEMHNDNSTMKYAQYDLFGISDEANGYTLKLLGQYQGDAGDSLSYHAGMKFSTYDVDNDRWDSGSCARSHFGGWWYKSCDESNLNGKYFENPTEEITTENQYEGIHWKSLMDTPHSLTVVRMMIRPIEIY